MLRLYVGTLRVLLPLRMKWDTQINAREQSDSVVTLQSYSWEADNKSLWHVTANNEGGIFRFPLWLKQNSRMKLKLTVSEVGWLEK
jgi:hypothetical protein